MADSNSEDDVVPRAGRRQRVAPVDAPVEDEPVDAPAEPVRRRRPAAAPVEAPAEAEEEAEAPSGPRRSARKLAKSAATKRRNLRESRRILAESGLNAENNREGVEEQAEEAAAEAEQVEEAGEEGEGEQQGEEMGPLGMIGAMLKSTVNYLKTDPYEQAFGNNRDEEPYPSLKELYETAKENPDSAETLRQVTSDFRDLKQRYHEEGCDTDINVSMNPRCIGVQAGLYMRLFDIRKSIDDSLEQMRPIQQQAVLARINREARPEYNGEDNVFVPAGV